MWVPRAWADDDIPALVGGGAGGAVRAGGGLHNAEAGVGNHSICEKSLCQPL